MDFTEVALLSRFHNLVRSGHIPCPGTLTEHVEHLGKFDTSGLP